MFFKNNQFLSSLQKEFSANVGTTTAIYMGIWDDIKDIKDIKTAEEKRGSFSTEGKTR